MPISIRQSNETEPLRVMFTLDVTHIPDEVRAEALAKAKESYVMALLAAGEISSGKAASLLGISRVEMIDRMGQGGISVWDDSLDLDELQQEVEQASATLNQHSL